LQTKNISITFQAINGTNIYIDKKSLKIPKGYSESVNPRRTETTQWPKEKGQTTIYKTYT